MSNRKNYTDIMLLLALAAMAVRGVALPVWSKSAPVNSVWDISGAYSVISAWGFPLLVAATGCKYLANSQSYSTGFVLKKLLPRALLGCAVWWLVSALTLMKYSNKNEIDTDTFFEAMSKALNAPYYARFLQLVVIFFAFYPLLKRIADDKKLTGYAVIVSAVFSAVVPVMKHIPYLSYGYMFLSQLNWGFFTEVGLYLFLGIFLSRIELEWHFRVVVYCAGVLSTVAMYSLTFWNYSQEKGMDKTYITEASPFTVIQTAAVILLISAAAKRLGLKSSGFFLESCARCSYVFVPLFAVFSGALSKLISAQSVPLALYIPLTAFIAAACALALGSVFRRVPILSFISI